MSENHSLAEILARRLDQVLPPDSTIIPPPTPDPLVNMAARLAALRIPEPSDITLARMEDRVLDAFDKQHQVQQPRRAGRQLAPIGKWAVAASFVLVLLTAGIVPASGGSLPGEPLYAVKRLTERVELGLASNEDAAARLRLAHAEHRALEALALLERGQFEETLLEEARNQLRAAEQSASANLRTSLTFQWQQWEVTELVWFVATEADETGDGDPSAVPPPATETPTATATETAQPTATLTQTASATQTITATPTATSTSTPSATATPSPTATGTLMPTAQPSDTPDSPPTLRPSPTPEPGGATDCPGNSCNSAGVPGGQIDPDNPPGQSGGRDDNPPDPPGQGDPGGGQGNGSGQGNSGNSGGGAPADPPPSNSGGNSGNGNSGGNGNGNGGGNGG